MGHKQRYFRVTRQTNFIFYYFNFCRSLISRPYRAVNGAPNRHDCTRLLTTFYLKLLPQNLT